MAGRPRLPLGTFGDIATTQVGAGRFRAAARFRDWDGETRQVTLTGASRNAARSALKQLLLERQRSGDATESLSSESRFADLAHAWLEDLKADADRSDGTKEVYERELRSLVLPTFEKLALREITVGRVDKFLRAQRATSYARAKHSRTVLNLVMGFAVRREIIARNPVTDTARMRKPKRVPKALTDDQIAEIRRAAREWRSGGKVLGPRSDGQVRDLIEVMLGTATRIGEVLALRKCDVDVGTRPLTVHVAGTIVVRTGMGVIRQSKTKTDESNRLIAVPQFAADVILRRLELLADAADDHLLFYTRNGTALGPHNVRRTFRDMLRSVGLDGLEITPHAFRRTGATALANEVDLETAANVLGHSSTATTRDHYAEPDRSAKTVASTVLQRFAPAVEKVDSPGKAPGSDEPAAPLVQSAGSPQPDDAG